MQINGLGAGGLFDAQPEVMVDAPVMSDAPTADEGLVDNFTRQAGAQVGGREPSYLVRNDGDVIATVDGRAPPQLADPPVSSPIPQVDTPVAEEGSRPAVDVPPYDGQEDIAEWLSREHDIVNMPMLMDTEPGTQAAEDQLNFAVTMVAAQIADGAIDPAAKGAIIEAFRTYDHAKFQGDQYSGYLEKLFDRAGEGHDAVEALSGERHDIFAGRASYMLAEKQAEPDLHNGPLPVPNL